MSEYQEEVLTGLLDLQAELRGDEPEPHDEPAEASSEEESVEEVTAEPEGAVAVSEGDVTVSLSSADPSSEVLSSGSLSSGSPSSGSPSSGSLVSGPSTTGLGVNERLAALHERLSQLEYDLAGVTKRIERIEPAPEVVSSGATDADVDARWRSFLDLQKIVADRLDQR
jgi:hypothetical protein